MFTSQMNAVGLRCLPQALPSRILHNTSRRSLAPTPQYSQTHILRYLSVGSRTFSSLSNSQFPRKLPRKLPNISSQRASPSLVAASFTLGFLYSLSWLLEIPPHKFIPDLLFDPRDDTHTILDEDKLAEVSYPDSFDFANDHFFNTLARARPLKYGHYLRQTQEDIRQCCKALSALEAKLRELRVGSTSPWDKERRKSVEEKLKRMQESLLFYKVRWLKLFILDQREGAWRTQPGFKKRTLESTVREWMGRDVENLVGELVLMGFIDVRAN